ncbi:ABC transporter ATP-binding protein [Kribbella endophytica]
MRGIGQALRLTWQTSRLLTCGYVVVALLGALPALVTAWLTKGLIDTLTAGGAQTGEVVRIGLALAGAGLLVALLPVLTMFVQKETERRVGLAAQDRLFRATERFTGMVRFEDPAFLDKLRLAQQYGGATPGVVVGTTLSTARTGLTAVGFLGSLLILSPWLPVLVLASAVPVLLAELSVARRRAALQGRLGPVERREFFYRELLTNVQAAKEIRLFGIGAFLRDRMSAERRHANRRLTRMDLRDTAIQTATGLLTTLFTGAALLWSLSAVLAGRISIGDISLLIAAIAGVQTAVVGLLRDVGNAHRQLLLFRNYLDVVDSEPDLPVPANPLPVPALSGTIEFDDVWFRYGPDQPWVLSGVDLRIAVGETVGLVGRNGAGKSTLIKLLCRMYDPVRGAVRWDGVDLRQLDPVELRRRIGAVFQDYMTYDLTAAENIGIGDLDRITDPAAVEAAGRRAGAHDFVAALPDGYGTLLSRVFFQGDDPDNPVAGVTLSGGQWQRLAIARAYARDDHDLVILDEPSSGLDAEAEAAVHQGLAEHRADRTSLLISHRLGSLRTADRLVVLDDGRVVEQGDHATLIRRQGLYAHLFALQAEGYQDLVKEAS